MPPASSSEKGSGTAMDWSMFSTPSMVRSPVLGGVIASNTGFFFSSANSQLMGLGFMRLFLSLLGSSIGS